MGIQGMITGMTAAVVATVVVRVVIIRIVGRHGSRTTCRPTERGGASHGGGSAAVATTEPPAACSVASTETRRRHLRSSMMATDGKCGGPRNNPSYRKRGLVTDYLTSSIPWDVMTRAKAGVTGPREKTGRGDTPFRNLVSPTGRRTKSSQGECRSVAPTYGP